KTASAFSGLPAYTANAGTLTPFYTGTTSSSYDFYYGVNVSTAKTPGTYGGEVLYTVLMNDACLKYTLNFNGNSATTNTLTSQDLTFDSTIDLSTISDSTKIARTGYTLTGWKDQNNNEYGTSGTADVNPSDLSSVTLTAQWQINSNNVTVSKGTNVTTTSGTGTYDYNSTVTISATAFSTGYHFSGWTVNSGGVTLYSNSSMTTTSTTSTPAYFKMPDNAVTVTANAAANTYTIKYNNGGGTGTAPSDQFGTYGGTITTRANTFSRTGYQFAGWSTTNGASSATCSASASCSVSTLASNAGVTGTNGATINLYAVWTPNTLSITYSANGGTGSASKTSESAKYGTNITMPTKNTLAKSGYDFLGWSLSSTATSATWTAGQTSVNPTAINSNLSSSTGLSTTVYAVWKSSGPVDDGNKGTMQSFSCTSVGSGHTATVTDSRDNQTYTIYRIPTDQTYEGIGSSTVANIAGKCIMTQDLSLGYVTGGSITKGQNLVLSTDTSAGSTTSNAPIYNRTGTSGWSTTNSDSNLQYINGPSSSGNAYSQHSYYSYGAAQKVCPAGWRLPTSAEYADNSSSGTPSTGLAAIVGNSSTGSTALQSSPWSFVLGGVFYSSGWYYQGSFGVYWSSTQYSSTNGYSLNFSSSTVYRSFNSKNNGRSVRCIAD
ncbi:InlB B-repeat-containing protein, partial [Candidatus Saccharibacteria bacterium]|nr:InlB B-repeat-containing protein [Candidatus Saccharibacteria bacterium]